MKLALTSLVGMPSVITIQILGTFGRSPPLEVNTWVLISLRAPVVLVLPPWNSIIHVRHKIDCCSSNGYSMLALWANGPQIDTWSVSISQCIHVL